VTSFNIELIFYSFLFLPYFSPNISFCLPKSTSNFSPILCPFHPFMSIICCFSIPFCPFAYYCFVQLRVLAGVHLIADRVSLLG